MRLTALTLGMAVLMACTASKAATYYVDAEGGSDTRSGRAPETAWRSLARAGQATLNPGDALLLKRGSVWLESLRLTHSGTLDAPIRVGAYGTGEKPVLDGEAVFAEALLAIEGVHNLMVTGLELRRANQNGVEANQCTGVTLRDLTVSGSRRNGILVFDCSDVTIENADVFGNAIEASESFDGIRIDGSGREELAGFVIRNSRIHDQIGGDGWMTANGIFIGHTGNMPPVLRGVQIVGNEIYSNGNPAQNQAGRGLTGTFHGDITVSLNRIHHNASAGLYLGDEGVQLQITIVSNFFTNNALRQFGGYTATTARAEGNTVYVDDPRLTAMGVEVGGTGVWTLRRNVFTYTTGTNDAFRGFIRINDATLDSRLDSDYNVFFSAGPQRWKRSNGQALNFDQWRQAGYDQHSQNLR